MLNYITPQDIIERIINRHPYWFHGSPVVKLEGDNGSFGKLIFDFGDTILVFAIYIKDKISIRDTAELAIANFASLSEKVLFDL